jgi:uncharacterized membrane protein YjjP (DUF1212 family)
MLGLLDRATQLSERKQESLRAEPPLSEMALRTTALAAALLFAHGQTTERTVVAAMRLGRALGVAVKVLPQWDELIVELDGSLVSQTAPARPLGVDMGRVLAVTTVIDQICDGALPTAAAKSALESAGSLPPASAPRFALFAAVGAASLGVIFGTLDAVGLLLIAASAAIGALVRRWLSGFSPLVQPLCAALVAGAVAAVAGRLRVSDATTLIAFCPCMVLVPGPHILNGAIDLARTRIALGITRLAYAGVIVSLICAGGLFGFTAAGGTLAMTGSSPPVPLIVDVIAAGSAVASFGTFFSMPWRLLPFPIAVGGSRLRRRCLIDAGLLPVQRRDGPCRIGLNRSSRTGRSADQYRRDRYHGTFDHHGHGFRADPPALAVRAPQALRRMIRHGRSMHRSAIQD